MISNLSTVLSTNSYFGRGIILGRSSEKIILAYFIMGRSANSRNRIFQQDGEGIVIKPFDASKTEDASLTIYTPIRRLGDRIIVSNGEQTDIIYKYLSEGDEDYFKNALDTCTFEPDIPNFTPRISGVLDFSGPVPRCMLSILKRNLKGECSRQYHTYCLPTDQGWFVHTYSGDGKPLPSFRGEPRLVPLQGTINSIAMHIWNGLNHDNRISLCVKSYSLQGECDKTVIYNKYQ